MSDAAAMDSVDMMGIHPTSALPHEQPALEENVTVDFAPVVETADPAPLYELEDGETVGQEYTADLPTSTDESGLHSAEYVTPSPEMVIPDNTKVEFHFRYSDNYRTLSNLMGYDQSLTLADLHQVDWWVSSLDCLIRYLKLDLYLGPNDLTLEFPMIDFTIREDSKHVISVSLQQLWEMHYLTYVHQAGNVAQSADWLDTFTVNVEDSPSVERRILDIQAMVPGQVVVIPEAVSIDDGSIEEQYMDDELLYELSHEGSGELSEESTEGNSVHESLGEEHTEPPAIVHPGKELEVANPWAGEYSATDANMEDPESAHDLIESDLRSSVTSHSYTTANGLVDSAAEAVSRESVQPVSTGEHPSVAIEDGEIDSFIDGIDPDLTVDVSLLDEPVIDAVAHSAEPIENDNEAALPGFDHVSAEATLPPADHDIGEATLSIADHDDDEVGYSDDEDETELHVEQVTEAPVEIGALAVADVPVNEVTVEAIVPKYESGKVPVPELTVSSVEIAEPHSPAFTQETAQSKNSTFAKLLKSPSTDFDIHAWMGAPLEDDQASLISFGDDEDLEVGKPAGSLTPGLNIVPMYFPVIDIGEMVGIGIAEASTKEFRVVEDEGDLSTKRSFEETELVHAIGSETTMSEGTYLFGSG
ncbi:hypothetical protein H4R33_000387 [Dimargaris cristalligena]|nr:hypothetical protein H4R33_000387 [Dimargaris cristalligena]